MAATVTSNHDDGDDDGDDERGWSENANCCEVSTKIFSIHSSDRATGLRLWLGVNAVMSLSSTHAHSKKKTEKPSGEDLTVPNDSRYALSFVLSHEWSQG